MRAPLLILVLLLAVFHYGISPAESYRTLPVHLRECYKNNGIFVPKLPLNLQVVLDIIRKIERWTYTSMSMRTLTTSMIKKFKLDGIVYSEYLPAREGVLRFAASGSQRARNRIVEELVPGDAGLLRAEEVLSRDELCLLHFALSNTVWDHYDPAEERFCMPGPNEKIAGNFPYRSIPMDTDKCPKEGGVILTPYGTVSLGSVLAAIAAALEPQLVKTRLLLSMPVDDAEDSDDAAGERRRERARNDREEEIDFLLPIEKMNANRSMWLQSVTISDTQVDNVWIATISGELAEMVIYQGPIYEDRMFLGATGFWNNTIRPQVYYVTQKHNSFDVTRAEIVGGVDGLVIAKNLESWMKKFENLRLSQVLDMYYSEKGIVFDKSVKACERGQHFPRLGPKALMEEQTYAAAQVLAYLNSIAAMSNEALQRLVVRSVEYFAHYTDDHLFTALQCGIRRRRMSRIEVTFAFDGSWTREYTADFLAALVDDFDVSAYGSRMGIIHGETGEWLQNVTGSPSTIHQAINNLTDITWPKGVKLNAVFESVLKYLDESWEEKRNNNTIGNYGQAVVLLVPQVTLTDEETKLALTALKKIKSQHPEVNIMYYTRESVAELFKPFLLSDEDRIVKSLDIDDISRLLSAVPMTLRPAGCNRNIPGTRLQLEDYVIPSETITYRLHPQWRVKTKKVTLSLHGVGYGTLKVCWWNQWTSNSKRLGTYCKDLSLYGDISLTDYNACDKNNECPNTYFQVLNVSTVTRCKEIDCKSPDQVRYIIRMENFECVSSSGTIAINLLLIIALLIFVTF